jgi:hypothetical protein
MDRVVAMRIRQGVLFGGLLMLAAAGWAQQKDGAPDQTGRVQTTRQELATLRKQLAAMRAELGAQNAARQHLLAQLDAVKGLQDQVVALRQQVELLSREIKGLKANSVLDLNGYLTFDTSNGYPVALFRGINLQIVNGTGDTRTMNGLGNLIVGYDRPSTGGFVCSLGVAESEAECRGGGGQWAQSHKSGSHNIVGGDFNNYSSWGGLVLGFENTISAPAAVVLSGGRNRAGGTMASITGGSYNTASGYYSAVSGGSGNRASGEFTTVSGGAQRTAPSAHDWAAGALFQDQ